MNQKPTKWPSYFDVKAIYQNNWLRAVLWAWVTALRVCAQWKKKEAIESFQQYFDAHEIDSLSLGATYTKVHNDFRCGFDAEAAKEMIVVDRDTLKEIIREVWEER